MNRAPTSLSGHFKRLRLAYLVLVLSLIPTVIVYYRVKANVDSREQARFDRLVNEAQAAVEQRFPHYIDEMLGVRGLFAANLSVSSNQWNRYIASLQVQRPYHGLRTLGYLSRLETDSNETFPAIHLNHFEPGLKGGMRDDHYADPQRRSIMDQSRDSGEPMASGKVLLATDGRTNDHTTGFVIYVPVYRNGAPTSDVEERRAALQGFIFANFDSEKFMRSLLNEPVNALLDCKVFDGSETTPTHLLFDNDNPSSKIEKASHVLVRKISLPVLNRSWTIYFSTLPDFESESQHYLPPIALLCWLTLSFLLFGLTCAEVNARARSDQITTALRKSEAALAAEKERLDVTLYSIADGVITTDTNGRVLSINKVAEQLTGWPLQEAIGKQLDTLLHIVTEETRQHCDNSLHKALRTGAICSLDAPALLLARDGKERLIADSAAPIRDREGAIIGAVAVVRDVTAQQKTEAEILKESKLESVGLLAGGIAHDFNNILQGVLGNLSLARMSAQSPERVLERLAAVERSAIRAKDLTQQLVMFARGGAPIRRRVHLIGSIKDVTLQALQTTNVHCDFSLPDDLWTVEVDEGQFRQVINNIVVNAAQSMPEGGKIELSAENLECAAGLPPALGPGKYVKISIRDFGTGIKPEHLSRIFDPYFTTRKHARGLGLASAYSVIRKHDGQITVDTQIGKGSTFQIYLPASIKPVEVLVPESDQKRLFGQGKILVMDDEPDILMLVREMLDLLGYDVEVARDGAEALQRYAAAKRDDRPIDVVIMDLTIPEGMGGKEAIRRLREFDPQVKAIVSSGYSYDPVMANYREYGFSGVIPKPYILDDLRRVVAEVIANSPVAVPHA